MVDVDRAIVVRPGKVGAPHADFPGESGLGGRQMPSFGAALDAGTCGLKVGVGPGLDAAHGVVTDEHGVDAASNPGDHGQDGSYALGGAEGSPGLIHLGGQMRFLRSWSARPGPHAVCPPQRGSGFLQQLPVPGQREPATASVGVDQVKTQP